MIVVRELQDITEVNALLQGGIIGGKSLHSAQSPAGSPHVNEGIYNLHGKTLIFTSPASETVTFASTNSIEQEPMTLQQISTQIEAQTTGVEVRWTKDRRLILIETIPSNGVTVTNAGTANALLGFGTGVNSSGKFYNSDFTNSPFILSVSPSSLSGSFVITTEE